jgi:hypothetical protein
MGNAPDTVKRLVDRFDQDRKVFLSPDYKEEQLRVSSGPSPSIRHSSFVIRTSPHESLGWDVANKAGLTEVFKPFIHEESIKIAGAESVIRSDVLLYGVRLLTCATMEAY